VDYEKRLLTLSLPSAFEYRGTGTIVPFTFNEHIPQVEGSLDGISGKFDIDTGARGSVTILAPFAEKNGLTEHYGAKVAAVTGWGVGGPARGLVTRARTLRLGTLEVVGPVVDLSQQKKGAFIDPYVAGNVGAGVLKRFNVTFDYGRQRLIFEPNANYARPDAYDRAGMWINRGPEGFEVVDVVAGGPAEEAGLKVGDRITAIGGTPAGQLSLPVVRERFRTEPVGTTIKLAATRNGKPRNLKLVLRDLVPGLPGEPGKPIS
jgi:membrane-associated protease RseP (regulator of RpoE activity)